MLESLRVLIWRGQTMLESLRMFIFAAYPTANKTQRRAADGNSFANRLCARTNFEGEHDFSR
jgi:hypothetical protein